MIATIEGRVAHKDVDHIILLVGGVGIEIAAPYSTIERITTERVFLYARLIVREESLTLYGFASEAERELFDALVKISGIGPKLANTILSTLTVDNVRHAVRGDRAEIFVRVPGIGKKTAEKILLELRDKIPAALEALPGSDDLSVNAEVLDALTALGYSVVEAQAAIQALPADTPDDSETRVFLALQALSA